MQHASFEDVLTQKVDNRTLIILVGIPGSGKTTLSRMFPTKLFQVLSLDNIRKELYGSAEIMGNTDDVMSRFYTTLERAFSLSKPIVVDNTNCKPIYRNELGRRAKNNGYKAQYWVFDTPLKTCLDRNAKRDRKVPVAIIRAMQKSLEAAEPTGNLVLVLPGDSNDFRFMV